MHDIKDKNMSQRESGDIKKDLSVGLVKKDGHFVFVHKKTVRIVSALYLVTGLFPENEPLRLQFRQTGISLVTEIASLRAAGHGEETVTDRTTPDFLRMCTLLEIAFAAGLISEMNYVILKREIENLLEAVKAKKIPRPHYSAAPVSFDEEFFAVSGETEPEMEPEKVVEESVKTGAKDRHIKDKETQVVRQVNPEKTLGERAVARPAESSRQSDILRLLKGGASLTMGDFSSVIVGCSEKTIQRELLKLVGLGVLKKSGERRWSRYSLAAPVSKTTFR